MTSPREMTPGDRRELRSLVKKQFAVLRNDVKRREKELQGEIEAELLRRYREQDEAIAQAKREMAKAKDDYRRACEAVAESLLASRPELQAQIHEGYRGMELQYGDANRSQTHRALLAAIPQQIADASTRLDQEELDLLRELTVGALDSDEAKQFLGRIPTVGQLVPKARMAEIEVGIDQ